MSTQWMARARCKDRTDLEWFPDKGQHAKETIKFCEGCPVRRQCFDYAIKHNLDDGIWGGVSSNRRIQYRRRLARSA